MSTQEADDRYDEACNLLDALDRLLDRAASVPEDRITEPDLLSALRSAYNALYVFDPATTKEPRS